MNPMAPVSMLAGKGSGTAVAVFGVLLVLAMLARAKSAQPTKNLPAF